MSKTHPHDLQAELTDAWQEPDYEPYGTDPRVAAQDYLRLGVNIGADRGRDGLLAALTLDYLARLQR
jgi:hypothetical protein